MPAPEAPSFGDSRSHDRPPHQEGPNVRKRLVPCRTVGTAMGRPASLSSFVSYQVKKEGLVEEGLKLSGVTMSAAEESKLDGNHIVVKCSLRKHDPIIETALCDTGATGYAFIDENIARQYNLPKFELRTPRPLDVIDGRPIASGDITHMVKVFVKIGNHEEELPAFITTLGHYKLVLGILWMRDHDVKLDFAENSLEFTADKCHTTCMNG